MVAEPAAGPIVRSGPFDVTAASAAVAAYRAATVPADAGAVPLAFTLRWLTTSDVRAALAGLLAADEVMVHEAQKFTAHAPLRVDHPYRMTLEVRRTEAPARVTAQAIVSEGENVPVLTIETVLRLVGAADLPR